VSRAALFCPGRGSYTEAALGSLPRDHEWVLEAEELRASLELPSLLELDGAERFRPSQHLVPENASPLIFLVSMLDAVRAAEEHRLVCVGGNSLGWYTALAVSGALSFSDGLRLVQTMGRLQAAHQRETSPGGQILYPLVGDDWRRVPAREAAVSAALSAHPGEVFPSVHLGGQAVLSATEAGLAALQRELPRLKLGKNEFPLRLAHNGPYHTELAAPVAEEARRALTELEFRAPRVTLVDGRGRRHTPWSADPSELLEYTLGPQVTTPYDFTAGVRVALREHAPDCVVLCGPGNTLGSIVGQILVAERWRGITDKPAFEREQGGERPPVLSMRR
jgi:malonyl CoA-acyl carrier protein transacylase